MANYSIPTPKSPFVDAGTGLVSREWFLYLNNLFGSVSTLTGSSVTATSGPLSTNQLVIADAPSDIASLTGLTASSVVTATSSGAIGTPVGLGTSTTVLHGNATSIPFYAAVSLTADVSGTLPVTSGGTGVSSYSAVSTVIVRSAPGTFSSLAAGTSTQVLHGNATTFPFYSAVSLTADVSGVLPIANGGTNTSAALNNSRMMMSSSGAIVEASALTNGQIFVGSTGAAPVASTLTAGSNIQITNAAGAITVSASTAGMIWLSSSTAASSATIDLTSGITSTFNSYAVVISDLTVTSDNSNFLMRVSEDGGVTFKAGATDYAWTIFDNIDGTNSANAATSATNMILVGNMSSSKTTSIEVKSYAPSDTTRHKLFKSNAVSEPTGSTIAMFDAAGLFKLDTNAINAFRFLPSAGFFSTGTFSLYGFTK